MNFAEAAFKHLQSADYFAPFGESIRRRGFFPTKDPAKLHNCKQYFWIQPDGTSMHAVYLNALEESFREEIILYQYLSYMVKTYRGSSIAFNILDRDNPWDFRIGFSTGATINVEITSVTDRPNFFRRASAEELIQRHSYYPEIRLGILQKIGKSFSDSEIQELIAGYSKDGRSSSDEVANPFYPERPKLFTSFDFDQEVNIRDQLRHALFSKQKKKHVGKNETILIVDNRTTTTNLPDFMRIYSEIEPLLRWIEFPEIWLYTGYGGGHDPDFEESLFLPLKLSSELLTV